MTLQEHIDDLLALQPPSVRDAAVVVSTGYVDGKIQSVSYDRGIVTIKVNDLSDNPGAYSTGYDEGYERGKAEGLKASQDRAGQDKAK